MQPTSAIIVICMLTSVIRYIYYLRNESRWSDCVTVTIYVCAETTEENW